MKEAPLLRIRNLTVCAETASGPVPVTEKLTLSIPKGRTLALVGESGCGKSMTALAIMRLLPEACFIREGEILFGDTDLLQLPEYRMQSIRGKKIGFVFQEPATSLNPVMTVGNQIGEVLTAHLGLKGSKREKAVIQWLARVGIPDPEHRRNAYPFELSGGQRQRCMIAMALAGNPQLLIADEPTTALDVTLQKQILELLLSLQKESGLSMLFITHDLAVVRKMAHRVALMYAGEIAEEADTEAFFSRPLHPYAKQLLASLPAEEKKGASLPAIPGAVPLPGEILTGCRFAPRCLQASSRCLSRHPEKITPEAGRSVLCFLPSEKHFQQSENGMLEKRIPGSTLLSVQNLRVWFPKGKKLFRTEADYVHAVDGISFRLAENETLALVGESGSGKTTAGRAVLQLLPPPFRLNGEILLAGHDMKKVSGRALLEARKTAQIIFQDPFSSLSPRMTIEETLREALESLCPGITPQASQKRLQYLLDRVGLPRKALSRYPHEFSGGQRQRIAVARALAPAPRLIICDEPTSALDVSVQAQILNLLGEIQQETHVSYLLITHNFGVVEYLADRIAVMKSGKLVECGTAECVLKNPQNAYTRALLRAVPRL